MGVFPLNQPVDYHQFFRSRVIDNVQYWQEYVAQQTTDIVALDDERDQIIKAISFAFDLEETWESLYTLIIDFSPYMERKGYWESWGWVLQRAIGLARHIGDGDGESNLSALLGLMLQRQNRFKEAILQHRRTIQIARRTENQFALARAYSNLGYIYLDRGYWYRAEVLSCHALRLFEQMESDYGCAYTQNHLGLLYMRQHRWELAQQHFEQAYAIWEVSGDTYGRLKGLINFSALCITKKQADQALNYLEQAQQQAKQLQNETEFGLIYLNKGIAYEMKGELLTAETYYRQAERIAHKFSNLKDLAFIWDNLSTVFIQQKKWAEAAFYLEKTLTTWQELGSISGQIIALFNFIDYAIAKGNNEETIVYLQQIEILLKQNTQDSPLQRFHRQLEQYRRKLIPQ